MQAVAGIPSEDDDGNNASKKAGPTKDDLAWVKAINNGQSLSDINDPEYRKYIEGLLK